MHSERKAPESVSLPACHAGGRGFERVNKLASFGLLSRRPAVVLQCGATSIAVEDGIGPEIFVRLNAA